MGMLENLAAKLVGLGNVIDAIKSKAVMIGGLASVLMGLAQLLNEFISIDDIAGLINFAKHIPYDHGTALVAAGLSAMGLHYNHQEIINAQKETKPGS